MLIVTSNSIPGYQIDAVMGEVMGMTVRSANFGANFTAGFKAFTGGEVTQYTGIMYESRQQVMERMSQDAAGKGANAIIAFRFDSGAIGQSFTEICAYGTAVVISPIPAGEPGATAQSAQYATPPTAPAATPAAAPDPAAPASPPATTPPPVS